MFQIYYDETCYYTIIYLFVCGKTQPKKKRKIVITLVENRKLVLSLHEMTMTSSFIGQVFKRSSEVCVLQILLFYRIKRLRSYQSRLIEIQDGVQIDLSLKYYCCRKFKCYLTHVYLCVDGEKYIFIFFIYFSYFTIYISFLYKRTVTVLFKKIEVSL